MTNPSPQQALIDAVCSDLICWYQPDELPFEEDETFWRETVPALAARSARRLRASVGVDGVSSLAQLLRDAATDPTHALVVKATANTLMDWGDEETWPFTQALFRSIADQL